MPCYTVSYEHRFGNYTSTKWAESAEDALAAVKNSHKKVSLSAAVGAISYEPAKLTSPQPFTDAAREMAAAGPVKAQAKPVEEELTFSLAA